MARKPRQRQERETKTIEIERNVIEQFLMDAKDFIKNNQKAYHVFLHRPCSAASLSAVAVLIVVGSCQYAGTISASKR